MRPTGKYPSFWLTIPASGLVAASHHVVMCDELNGYCLNFFSSPKAFNK
ncbi:hypothetical protein SAMN05421545_1545 [Pontibacter lucknowensis]|uniref:Uncharacterized protein n=1 Tax=Pontibacter lucknowensis TaxID=1077936 RepID=A0A1N6WHU7_9BACT|nr:hypothetical protein SAMN05421545_1545 [Pontibacter lucknowensis]